MPRSVTTTWRGNGERRCGRQAFDNSWLIPLWALRCAGIRAGVCWSFTGRCTRRPFMLSGWDVPLRPSRAKSAGAERERWVALAKAGRAGGLRALVALLRDLSIPQAEERFVRRVRFDTAQLFRR